MTEKSALISLFESGDQPTGRDFADLINSCVNVSETTAQSIQSDLLVNGLVVATTVSAAVGKFSRLEADVTWQLGVDSIAELKTVTSAADGSFLVVKGYRYAGDRGGGIFYYDADASAADDYGTIIQPDDGIGRWIRVYEEPINVCWFGAIADGVTDSTQGIRNALSVAGSIYLPTGPYLITDTLEAKGYPRFKMSGPGVLHAQIDDWPSIADLPLVLVSGCDYVDIDGIGVNASLSGWNGSRNYCLIGIKVAGASTARIRNCNLSDINGGGILSDAKLNVIGGNVLSSVAAFNDALTVSGDGIACVPRTVVRGGMIAANTIRTSTSHRGRFGIYMGGGIEGPEISDNDVAGYEYDILCSAMTDADITNNILDKSPAPITIAKSSYINILGNTMLAGVTVTAVTTAEGLTLIDSQHITISNNRIMSVSGQCFRADLQCSFFAHGNYFKGPSFIKSGSGSPYMQIFNNVFALNDLSMVGLNITCTETLENKTVDRIELSGNRFEKYQLYLTSTNGPVIRDNVFDFQGYDYWPIRLATSFNEIIEDNVFIMSTIVGATAAALGTYKCYGKGKLNNNLVISRNDIKLCSGGNDTYNRFTIDRPNYREDPITKQRKPITFLNRFNITNEPYTVYASAGFIPHGWYNPGARVHYVDAASGTTATDVCISKGWVGTTVEASTVYYEGQVIYGVSGIYTVMVDGTSSTATFTTAGGIFVDGDCKLAWAAASGKAQFRYASILS